MALQRTTSFLRRHLGKLVFLLLLALGITYGAVQSALGPRVEVVAAARRELVDKIVASGRVRQPARIEIGSLMLGTVAKGAVDEGDRVKAGDLLIELVDLEARAQVAQARAGVDLAEARIGQVRSVSSRTADEALRQAEINLAQAEREIERTRALVQSGALAQDALDRDQRALDLARSQRDAAATQAQSAGARGSESRLAFASLGQARAALLAAEARLAQTRILAPADGVILTRSVEPGAVVQPGAKLLSLAKDGPPELLVEPDEKALAHLRPGQRAIASADAFPAETFQATVKSIAPAVDAARGTVEVKLSTESPPPVLRPDMTVSVEIEVDRRAGALVLPAEAVRNPSSKAPWVLAVQGGRAERREIKLGIAGEGSVEIAAGLAEGEQVILPSAGPIEPGRKVRPRPRP